MRRSPIALLGTLVFLSACLDGDGTGLAGPEGIPADLLEPALDLVDANNGEGGNGSFFFLKPLTNAKSFDGVADGSLSPTVEICLRNSAGDGCEEGTPPLATFTRDSGLDKNRIEVDTKDEYSVHWRMNDFTPQRDGVYRIRVLLQGSEFGHADVLTMRNKEIKAFNQVDDDVIPISDKGAFKIAFRIEEGALEDQFCDFDQDGDVADCEAAVEVAGDGQPTVVSVTAPASGGGTAVVAVVTVNDAVFTDAQGNPVPNVVVTAEVETAPPSQDLLTNDLLELPYFVEINTFPDDVFIDPNGPGVKVVVCQDEAALAARGIGDPLHPQLILYKVTDPKAGFPNGETKRLPSTFGAPECDGFTPQALRPRGPLGLVKTAMAQLGAMIKPTPVSARRLHGGLNTIVVRGISSSDAAFSTFGALLGPNASVSTAIVPGGQIGVPTPILVEVRNALGDLLPFGGDSVFVSITNGPNAGAPVTVVDAGSGLYQVSYTPTSAGTDEVTILLTTAEGWAQGPLGASPYTSVVDAPMAVGTYADVNGIVGTAEAWDPAGGAITVNGPGGPLGCGPYQPAGIAADRAVCWHFQPATSGSYTLTSGQGTVTRTVNGAASVPLPIISAVNVVGSDVTVDWTGDAATQGSFLVRVWNNGIVAEQMVSSSTLVAGVGSLTLAGVPLTTGATYQVNVFAFNADLTTSGMLPSQFNAGASDGVSFVHNVNPNAFAVDLSCNDRFGVPTDCTVTWLEAVAGPQTAAVGPGGLTVFLPPNEQFNFRGFDTYGVFDALSPLVQGPAGTSTAVVLDLVGQGGSFCGGTPRSLSNVRVVPNGACAPGVVSSPQEAILLVQHGGTIEFDAGTHVAMRLDLPVDDITLRAVSGTSPVILSGTGSPTAYDGPAFKLLGAGDHVVQDITFRSPGTGNGGIGIIVGPNNVGGIAVYASALIQNVDFEDLRIGAALVPSSVPGASVTVTNSRIRGKPTGSSNGLLVIANAQGAANTVVTGNTFTGYPGTVFSGVFSVDFGQVPSPTPGVGTITNNVFDGTAWGVRAIAPLGNGSSISNNTVLNPAPQATGILAEAATGATLTIANNAINGVFLGGLPSDFNNYSFATGVSVGGVAASQVSLQGNVITGAGYGLQHTTASSVTGTDLTIDQVFSTVLSQAAGSFMLHNSDLTNYVLPYDFLGATPSGALSCNWWGNLAGPNGAGSGDLVVTPWAIAPVANGAGGPCIGS